MHDDNTINLYIHYLLYMAIRITYINSTVHT